MFEPKNYVELCSAMQQNTRVRIDGFEGEITGIDKQGGSSRIFTVKLENVDGADTTAHHARFVDK